MQRICALETATSIDGWTCLQLDRWTERQTDSQTNRQRNRTERIEKISCNAYLLLGLVVESLRDWQRWGRSTNFTFGGCKATKPTKKIKENIQFMFIVNICSCCLFTCMHIVAVAEN